MSNTPNYRLSTPVLDGDRDMLLAVQDLADFKPVNPTHSAESLTKLCDALTKAEEAERRAQKALVAARDMAIAAGWEFHNTVQGAKAMVIAQYGSNSQAVQAIGLKKKSGYKRPTRRRGESSDT